jgi:hypothetical protein
LTVKGNGATYQWQFNGANLSGATGSSLALANVGTTQAGTYDVVVTSGFLAEMSNPVALTVNVGAHLVNLSGRAFVGTDSQVLVAGFVVSSPSAKQTLIRAVGPTLSQFSVIRGFQWVPEGRLL